MERPAKVRNARKTGDAAALSAMGRIGGINAGLSKRQKADEEAFLHDIEDAKRINEMLQMQLDAGEITREQYDASYRHIV